MRQRVANMGLGHWFHPSITIHRKGGIPPGTAADARVIQRGDMLHTDFGLVYLGLLDRHAAQRLRPASWARPTRPPASRPGSQAANRLQDLTMKFATVGSDRQCGARGGARADAKAEGLTPSIYCHPVGYHGHAAGPPIGMTDYQNGVPVRGDYVFRPDTWHSIELNVRHAGAGVGQPAVMFALEEDAALTAKGWDWIDGRQTKFYLIK